METAVTTILAFSGACCVPVAVYQTVKRSGETTPEKVMEITMLGVLAITFMALAIIGLL